VWVTDVETVPGALDSLERLFAEGLGVPAPGWLRAARDEWCGPVPEPALEVAVAVWRDPWMAVGRDTFTGDVVARLGWHNVLSEHEDRYPHVDLEDLDREGVDVVLLPDEPYVFTDADGPEAFRRTRTALVSGRLLTWYGPSLVGARRPLLDAVARAS
jgi:hypothetical protein